MNKTALQRTLALGALTGMRSMAGPAALAMSRGGMLARIAGVMAAGEMVADKTDVVGDRIDAVPLAGRAVMGALVGAVIAHESRGNIPFGMLLGASTAVAAAHVAYHLRKRLPVSNVVGGLVEDALVVGAGSRLR